MSVETSASDSRTDGTEIELAGVSEGREAVIEVMVVVRFSGYASVWFNMPYTYVRQ